MRGVCPDLGDDFMEPTGSRRKNPPIAISDRLAPFVAGHARIHTQKRMFMAVIREVTGIETVWTKIKDQRGVHRSSRYILYILALLIFQSVYCSVYAQFSTCVQSLAFCEPLQIAEILFIQALPHALHHRLEESEETAQLGSPNASYARPLGYGLEVETRHGLEKAHPIPLNPEFLIWLVFSNNESGFGD